jgi:hypothetical protein
MPPFGIEEVWGAGDKLKVFWRKEEGQEEKGGGINCRDAKVLKWAL